MFTLSTLSRSGTPAEMVKEMKRGSSLWVKTKSPDLHDFAWQNGYGIFSIGFSQMETVRNYNAGQPETINLFQLFIAATTGFR